VRLALERGVNLFQCSHAWGRGDDLRLGRCEEVLAQALRGGYREKIILCGMWCGGPTAVDNWREQFERGLQRYGTDHYDLYFLEGVNSWAYFERVLGPGGVFREIKRAQEAGKIRYLGAACHASVEDMLRILDCGNLDAFMVSFNAAEFHLESGQVSAEDVGRIGREILPHGAQRDIGLLAMKPLGGGLLCSNIASPALRAMVSTPPPIPASLALRFVLERREIASAVVGMASPWEVEENCSVGAHPLPLAPEERARLSQAVQPLSQRYCRSCRHCEPSCPEEIPIGSIFQWEATLAHLPTLAADTTRSAYRSLEHDARSCTECGECEEHCPYGIEIMEGLRRAHLALTRK
jgi:hypothetical protein